MTYDAQEIRAAFIAEEGLKFPLLQDIDAQHVNSLGVRNLEYESGSKNYGIPYPGILFVSASGEVLGKFAQPGYRERPDFAEILGSVKLLLGTK